MRDFYFTISASHAEHHFSKRRGGYVRITAGSAAEARVEMDRLYGDKWAFQYDSLDSIHPLDLHDFAHHVQTVSS